MSNILGQNLQCFFVIQFLKILIINILKNMYGPGGPTKKCLASMAKHFLLPDVGDCAIFDIRRLANFVQSHTSCNRCNRAILLFGA